MTFAADRPDLLLGERGLLLVSACFVTFLSNSDKLVEKEEEETMEALSPNAVIPFRGPLPSWARTVFLPLCETPT